MYYYNFVKFNGEYENLNLVINQKRLDENEKLIQLLKIVYDVAEREGKHGFSNFLAERMDAHEKHGWMLRSSL